ncbi:MAG: hypothetical protein JSR09_10350 [Bacteroidetes bacterium]|nr:hypothetical protein [Bacteroidota bacterium]MBS1650091.1 hypothetical protein [Bacteroidota bacterium]
MKKTLVLFTVIVCCSASVNAQLNGIIDKAKTASTVAGLDVNKVSNSIMNTLTSKLNLTAVQTPKVANAVNTFIQAKSKIIPLLKTNKAEYTQKQTSLFNTLKTNLTAALAKEQMNKFLGLKPSVSTPNVLSNLFY